jgi:ubiquitin C-terminal hydrolase
MTSLTNGKKKKMNEKRIYENQIQHKMCYYNTKIGLENLGNTCYLNTSLQCLIHSKKFVTEFMRYFESPSNTSTISNELYKILTEIVKLDHYNTYRPKHLLTSFCQKHKKFKGFVQHDSQEFLRILLEDISSDLNRVKRVPEYKELKLKNKSKLQANTAFHNLFIEREDSIIIDLFYGQVCNIFACEMCNHKTYSFEKIMDIPILLGKPY